VQQSRQPERRGVHENNLSRDTPFVASIKFRNTLPELPCDPKLLARQHDTEALSRFHLTSAEENLRPDLLLAPDPSLLSAMHMQKFCYVQAPGNNGPELHPDDRALIEGQMGARAARGQEVAWLMKTRCWVFGCVSMLHGSTTCICVRLVLVATTCYKVMQCMCWTPVQRPELGIVQVLACC
jgi:hypothetical protein